MKTICFTGHRPQKLGGWDENNPTAYWVKQMLRGVIKHSLNHQFDHFIAGGALGVDTWAAEEVLAQRDRGAKLTIAVPCLNQDIKWIEESKTRYQSILSRADRVEYVTQKPYTMECMQLRNQWMVDRADVVVAVWDGSSGGTGNCVRYAKGKQILRIDPIAKKVFWM